jgi:hypothetical protein
VDLRIKKPFSEVVEARADWNVNKTAHTKPQRSHIPTAITAAAHVYKTLPIISANQAQPHSISISIQAMEFYILFAGFFRYFIPMDR